MSDYIEVLDETDPGSILDVDTLIHTDKYFIVYQHNDLDQKNEKDENMFQTLPDNVYR